MNGLPSKLGHIEMLGSIAEHNRKLTALQLGSQKARLEMLGTGLSILYQAATCHRKCFGGPHVLERLAGRAYNLACAAYILTCRGFYDEAMNLVRSLGEIANLVALSVVDKASLKRWLGADTRTRIKEFGPAKVRELLSKHESFLTFADRDWYSQFCENYTHVHPGTRPNVHNDSDQAFVGGVVQEAGLEHAITEIANVTAHLALLVATYVEFDDLFEELACQIGSTEQQPERNGAEGSAKEL
jgi:hypothetical protein